MTDRVCERCGLTWQYVVNKGRGHKGPVSTVCPSCRAVKPTAYRLALSTTNYRLAIEMARTALRMGSPAVALEALDSAVQAHDLTTQSDYPPEPSEGTMQ